MTEIKLTSSQLDKILQVFEAYLNNDADINYVPSLKSYNFESLELEKETIGLPIKGVELHIKYNGKERIGVLKFITIPGIKLSNFIPYFNNFNNFNNFIKKQRLFSYLAHVPTFTIASRNLKRLHLIIDGSREIERIEELLIRNYRWKSWPSRSLKFNQWQLSDLECFKIVLLSDLEKFTILMWIVILEILTIIPWKLLYYEPIKYSNDNYRDARGIFEDIIESTSNSKNLPEIEWTDWQALLIVAVCTFAAIAFVKYWNQSIYLNNVNETLEVIVRTDHQFKSRIKELEQQLNTVKETLRANGHFDDSKLTAFMERKITCPMQKGENVTKFLLEKIESYQSAYKAGADLTNLTEKLRDQQILQHNPEIINQNLQKIVDLGLLPGEDGIGLLGIVIDFFK